MHSLVVDHNIEVWQW